MKLKTVQLYKQLNDTVESDFNLLNDEITKLSEMLNDEDFDGDEVIECCEQIKELAKAIANGVESR
ncbi:hypothetical protein [Aliterella atlantica]|uniref:Uncharacterized protein n=1 Tax=Aliterella atlantica CENA595 TaxID=1618023 RepID=A0A0D8ZP53_9CYAN|nr:hypothetical protein [Aliterella atlantica]KJH70249.1 hypothetical protein UH38_19055 [Aliterella atlantica CENA595]